MANDKCRACGTNMVSIELRSGGADVPLCPNCALGEALKPTLKTEETGKDCVICCGKAHAVAHDFKFDDDRTRVSYDVCHAHFRAICQRNLTPLEFHCLREAIGGISFNIHDDFYDEDSGEACQPHLPS